MGQIFQKKAKLAKLAGSVEVATNAGFAKVQNGRKVQNGQSDQRGDEGQKGQKGQKGQSGQNGQQIDGIQNYLIGRNYQKSQNGKIPRIVLEAVKAGMTKKTRLAECTEWPK